MTTNMYCPGCKRPTKVDDLRCPECREEDAGGGIVGSLTEAVMGTTGGLMAIAAALDRIADALEQKKAI